MPGPGTINMKNYSHNKEIQDFLPSTIGYFKAEDLYRPHWNINSPNIELPRDRLFIINASDEIFNKEFVLLIDNYCTKNQLNYLITCPSIIDHLVTPNVYFYPDAYYWSRRMVAYPNIIDLCSSRRYLFSCLNGTPWPHRIINYLTLLEKNYFDKFLFSMHNFTDIDAIHKNFKSIRLNDDQIRQWKSLAPRWPTFVEHASNSMKEQGALLMFGTNNDAYQNSYINLITESHVEIDGYLSEKTWKAISNGQLFIVLGGVNTIGALRSLGVDCFDDIIDHDYYDHEKDFNTRLLKIHDLLLNLSNLDIQSIWLATQHRRQSNIDGFFNESFGKNYLKQILEKIQ